MKDTTFVGMDVHKDSIYVAVARAGMSPTDLGSIRNEPEAVARLVRKIGDVADLRICYEAGPCGYGLYRQMVAMGARCEVVAPSLVPERAGDRVKTDRRDARKLAGLLRAGELTAVWVPGEEHEALRDLMRAREDAADDLLRKRNQLSKYLLRLGMVPGAGVRAWGSAHKRWLESLKMPHPAQQIVYAEYLKAIDEVESRIERLDKEIEAFAEISEQAPVIRALQSLKGVRVHTAATVVAEMGDLRRFESAGQAMDYVGLVPSEHSSGQSRYRGGITKTGNSHARKVIVEAAWHYRHIPHLSEELKRRQKALPESINQISWKAQSRLNRKFRKLLARGKPVQVAVVAVARELVGFMWAIARQARSTQRTA